MVANSGSFKPGHAKLGGKKIGSQHQKTIELKEFLVGLRSDPEYHVSARRRVLAGKAPHIETLMIRDELGDPTQSHKVDVTFAWQNS